MMERANIKLIQQKNLRCHHLNQIPNSQRAWAACEPAARNTFVDRVRDLNMYNCHQHEYLEAHQSKDDRATVCLYALGIVFILISNA